MLLGEGVTDDSWDGSRAGFFWEERNARVAASKMSCHDEGKTMLKYCIEALMSRRYD